MVTCHWTHRASDDFEEIADYITTQSHRPSIAEQLVRDVRERAEFFAARPGAGPRHPQVPAPMRVFLHKRWVVVYQPREDGDGIDVLRVLDGSRDFTKLF